jgi:dTDP-4-amino-4,6-dideoxygalactose transaminase
MKSIPFNKPWLSGRETEYIIQAVQSGKISGDGMFTKRCHEFFENKYGFGKVLLTSSCSDALEMAALLIDTRPGDEIIIPSFTFVSTANAFVLRGATIVFADSSAENPNIDAKSIEALITPRTKAIVPVHYAGIACDMDVIMALAEKNKLLVIEDAAQAIDSFYKDKPLGSIGQLAAFSFHETKNIISGEGGMIVVNDKQFAGRAEVVREKGTNRSAFFRGEIDKYGWVDMGSSFLPSDMIAAFLWAQIENLEDIQAKRKHTWNLYYENLKALQQSGKIGLPDIPAYATNNAHMFYIVCSSLKERTALIEFLRQHNIHSVFHYQSLHNSPYYKNKHDGRMLKNADMFTDCLLRLPFYYELSDADTMKIIASVKNYYH